MNVRYLVELSEEERLELLDLIGRGKLGVRKLTRAHILLQADGHDHSDQTIADALSTSVSTVARTRKRFVEEGLEAALAEKPRRGGARKLNALQEASLVALACSDAPPGQKRWTLHLLADRMAVLWDDLPDLSHETVRKRLKEKKIKPWLKKMWCIRKVDAAFIARMEDLLDLYSEAPDPRFPVICFDEGLKQLVGEVQVPRPVKPGHAAQQDYHYKRNGTVKLLVFLDAHSPWRQVIVSERRTRKDFALAMRRLVDEFYPEAERIRVVMDNLNTHNAASLYQTFPAPEARRILRRLEFHYTPTHASWLNMVEIESGVLMGQCFDRRPGDIETLRGEVEAWVKTRNDAQARIRWLFTVEKAREKMARHYPEPTINQSSSP